MFSVHESLRGMELLFLSLSRGNSTRWCIRSAQALVLWSIDVNSPDLVLRTSPSGNLLHSYWKWPSRNSGFAHWKWRFSHQLCESLPEGKTTIFLRFSYPHKTTISLVFLWFPIKPQFPIWYPTGLYRKHHPTGKVTVPLFLRTSYLCRGRWRGRVYGRGTVPGAPGFLICSNNSSNPMITCIVQKCMNSPGLYWTTSAKTSLRPQF